jgi:signal transduction histidine kinase
MMTVSEIIPLFGNAISLPGVVTDITDRKRAEEDRERLVAQLQEHDKEKNDFLAILAHELRNPLAVISNAVMLLTLTDVKEHRDYSTVQFGDCDGSFAVDRPSDHRAARGNRLLRGDVWSSIRHPSGGRAGFVPLNT